MDVYLRILTIGPNVETLTLTTDSGVVIPWVITRAQAMEGINLYLPSDFAHEIYATPTGACQSFNPYTLVIKKTSFMEVFVDGSTDVVARMYKIYDAIMTAISEGSTDAVARLTFAEYSLIFGVIDTNTDVVALMTKLVNMVGIINSGTEVHVTTWSEQLEEMIGIINSGTIVVATAGTTNDMVGISDGSTTVVATMTYLQNSTAVSNGSTDMVGNLQDSADCRILNVTALQIRHEYGLLYNWYAATDARGIAPIGWHIPTMAEWQSLQSYIEPGFDNLNNTIGEKLKTSNDAYWDFSNTGTDIYGFNGRGAGYRTSVFTTLNQQTFYMSSSLTGDQTKSWYLRLMATVTYAAVIAASGDKFVGKSIRLVKDNSTNEGTMTDIDGNVYPTVTIGNQVWMAANLRVTHYNDGSLIPEVIDNDQWAALTTGAMCAYNNDWINV